MSWNTLTFSYGSLLTSSQMTQMYDNFGNLATGDGGAAAPQIQTAAIAAAAITQSLIAASAVGQSQLKATSGSVNSNSTTGAVTTLPGGAYGFFPQWHDDGIHAGYWGAGTGYAFGSILSSSFRNGVNIMSSSVSYHTYARQYYIQASPPYDLGNGPIPLFVFAAIDKTTGAVNSCYVAQDPPWANNGPTNIRAECYGVMDVQKNLKPSDVIVRPADYKGKLIRMPRAGETMKPWQLQQILPYTATDAMSSAANLQAQATAMALKQFQWVEVTQAMKQADMPLIPHPWPALDPTKEQVVLLDPLGQLCQYAADCVEGDPGEGSHHIAQIVVGAHVAIGNTQLSGLNVPPGVMGVSAALK